MNDPMMKCGHAANATNTENGKRVCANCAGIVEGWDQIADPPDLTGREALCPYCKKRVPSTTELAFFEHRPDKEFDIYYCGCMGWN